MANTATGQSAVWKSNSEDIIVNYGPFFYASMPTYILYNDCYRCAGLIQFAMQEKHVGCGFLAVLCP